MFILPVLDLLDGLVVRGLEGKRNLYRPLVSPLANSPDPLDVAEGLRRNLGLSTFYLADLDGILHQRPNLDIYRRLAAAGCRLWIDAGLRSVAAAGEVRSAGAERVIAGLETWPGPGELAQLVEAAGADHVVFSLDLQGGRLLGAVDNWAAANADSIADQAIASGVRSLIVLDLAQVGAGRGPGTTALCQRIRARHPDVQLVTGGGVRGAGDLSRLQALGVDAALVASALHAGTIGPEELARLRAGDSPCT